MEIFRTGYNKYTGNKTGQMTGKFMDTTLIIMAAGDRIKIRAESNSLRMMDRMVIISIIQFVMKSWI